MTPKPVRLGDVARLDVRAILSAYRTEAGEADALRFAQALERALRHIGAHPASGSPRYREAEDAFYAGDADAARMRACFAEVLGEAAVSARRSATSSRTGR